MKGQPVEKPSRRWDARGIAFLVLLWFGPSLLFVGLSTIVYRHFRITGTPALEEQGRSALLVCLREGLERTQWEEPPPDRLPLVGRTDGLVVRIYNLGRVVARLQSAPGELEVACQELAAQMAADPRLSRFSADSRRTARIHVEHVIGRGPTLEWPSLLAGLTLQPGLDGLGVVADGQESLLLPSELVDAKLLVRNRPLSFVPDLVFGFDRSKAEPALRKIAGLDARAWETASKSYFRFRTEAYVEDEGGHPLVLERDVPPAPELDAASLREGALAGGRYLIAHMMPSGRYIYLANLSTGWQSGARGAYSLPRHAGTTYFLAELYRLTGESFLLEPIERAFGHLSDLVQAANCRGTTAEGAEFACVSDHSSATSDLGSTALAVVALAEYQRATKSSRFEPLMRQMAEFLLYMQRADGSFAHRYDWKTRQIDEDVQLLYYAGEASLALARMHKVTGEERYLRATERALDSLLGWYDFFLGGFFYGEEHWTCIAAEAAYPDLDKREYWDFCKGYGRFLRRNQPAVGTFQDQRSWAGAYYFTPFLAPQNTPAGSRSEAMISTYQLGLARAEAQPALRRQILSALRYALAQQVRSDGLYRVPPVVHGLGAIPGGPIDRDVRIDYVQHVCSAMIRMSKLLEDENAASAASQVIGSE
jgi:hypothetical protein